MANARKKKKKRAPVTVPGYIAGLSARGTPKVDWTKMSSAEITKRVRRGEIPRFPRKKR